MRKNDRSLINVLEGKVSVFFSKFFSPPFIPPLCSRRVEKSLVWLAWPLEAAANMVQRSRILPTHGISPFTNRTAFVSFLPYLPLPSLLPEFSSFRRFSSLETYSTSFLFLSWKNIGGEIIARILREIIGGILEAKFFFFLPLSRNRIVWFEGKNIFFFLCDSRGEEE